MIRAALRSLSTAGAAITASYALLCASPFTFHDLIRSNMFGVADVAVWHRLWYWGWLAVIVIDMRRAASGRRAAWLACAAIGAAIGVYNLFRPILPSLVDDSRSVATAGVALVPLVWIALVDHRSARTFLSASYHSVDDRHIGQTEARLLVAALGGAVMLAIASAVLVPLLMSGQFEPDLLNAGLVIGLLWTLTAMTVIAAVVFLALALLLRLVGGERMPWQYAIVLVTLVIAMSYCIDQSVSSTLGFTGWSRIVVDADIAVAIVATWGAVGLRRSMDRGTHLTSPVEIFLGTSRLPSPDASRRTILRFGVFIVAIVTLTYAVTLVSRRADWDFLLLRTAIFGVWLLVSAHLFRLASPRGVGARTLILACLLPFVAWLGTRWVEDRSPDARRSLRRYAIYNGPLRLADAVLRRPTGAVPAFQRYLRDNSGLNNLDVKPMSLDFVSPLHRAPRQPPPNIFLLVVDSLRPDYLSPYNPAVTFTPNIAKFADESVVFRNAITRYGATGLSLPAIWSGAVGPHKQYVTPFSPMNTLEKLLDANAYRRVMGVDVPMDQLLQLPADLIQLDRGRRTLDYELCQTLGELEARLPIGPDDPPVFVYSSPKNLHLSNLMSASVPKGETYPGFHAPYAARVHAIDRCLGQFVDFLKQRRAYDRSVIVITSDHGEMLGEEGRWGHAYYLFPQILRIPLIVHLPRHASDDVETVDVASLSFTTDISPTIYAALGYRPRPTNRLMGHPLIGAVAPPPLARRRGDYVVEASYSAVYGVVRRNGRQLYIVDAMSGAEYAYGRGRDDRWNSVPVVDALRQPAQRIIREHVDEIRRVYRLPVHR
jgi:hypothetical protein